MSDRIRTEDEWFAKHERTLIEDLKRERKRREERVAQALKQEEGQKRKELHWMKCPKCGSQMKEEPLHENILIDRCSRCGGLFFDRGELEDILMKPVEKRKEFRIGVLHLVLPSWKSKKHEESQILKDFEADIDRRKKEVEKWLSTEEGQKAKELHFIKCPKDGSDLKESDLGFGVIVDDCSLCRGIFLDFGEVESIGKLTEQDRHAIRDRVLALSIEN